MAQAFKDLFNGNGHSPALNPDRSLDRKVDVNVSELDLRNPPPPPREPEDVTVKYVRRCWKESCDAKRQRMQMAYLCKAFERGNQDTEWSGEIGASGGLARIPEMSGEQDKYYFMTANQIRPLIQKLTAHASMNMPDVAFAPLRDDEMDRMASNEARCIRAALDRKFDRQKQLRHWLFNAETLSTTWLKLAWNPQAWDYIPTLSPDGKVTGVKQRRAGYIQEEVVLPFEIGVDPAACVYEDARWLIHGRMRTISYIFAKYKVMVKPTVDDNSYMAGDASLNALNGEYGIAFDAEPKAMVLEYWEKPGSHPNYPDGRLMTVAGDRLVRPIENWPLPNLLDIFPFVPLSYQEDSGTIWGRNAVQDLIKPQMAYNKAWTRIMSRINSDKFIIAVRRGAEIGVGKLANPRDYMVLHFDGEEPHYMGLPPIPEAWFQALVALRSDMMDIAGVHEVSRGDVGHGVTAASAIDLLLQSDSTQMADYIGNIEAAATMVARIELAIWEVNGIQIPRLVGLQDSGSPSKALAQAETFAGLRGGGHTRVVVTPGSAAPKTRGARREEIIKDYEMGLYGPVGSPGAIKTVWEEREMAGSDGLTERVLERMPPTLTPEQVKQEEIKAKQEQMQAEMEMEQRKLHAAAEMKAIETKSQIELMQAKAAIDIQMMQTKCECDIRVAQAKSEADTESKAALSGLDHEESMEELEIGATHDATLQHLNKVTPSASFSTEPIPVGPTAARSAQEAMGLTPDPLSDLRKAVDAKNAPKPTQTARPSRKP